MPAVYAGLAVVAILPFSLFRESAGALMRRSVRNTGSRADQSAYNGARITTFRKGITMRAFVLFFIIIAIAGADSDQVAARLHLAEAQVQAMQQKVDDKHEVIVAAIVKAGGVTSAVKRHQQEHASLRRQLEAAQVQRDVLADKMARMMHDDGDMLPPAKEETAPAITDISKIDQEIGDLQQRIHALQEEVDQLRDRRNGAAADAMMAWLSSLDLSPLSVPPPRTLSEVEQRHFVRRLGRLNIVMGQADDALAGQRKQPLGDLGRYQLFHRFVSGIRIDWDIMQLAGRDGDGFPDHLLAE